VLDFWREGAGEEVLFVTVVEHSSPTPASRPTSRGSARSAARSGSGTSRTGRSAWKRPAFRSWTGPCWTGRSGSSRSGRRTGRSSSPGPSARPWGPSSTSTPFTGPGRSPPCARGPSGGCSPGSPTGCDAARAGRTWRSGCAAGRRTIPPWRSRPRRWPRTCGAA
jgi:hypothetical protein